MSAVTLDPMPPCVGHHLRPFQCEAAPESFVVGVDLVDLLRQGQGEELVLVYGAACSDHVGALQDWLSQPLGAWTVPYEVHVLRELKSALDGEYSGALQLVPDATRATG